MNRVISNQEYLWKIVRSTKNQFKQQLSQITEVQLTSIIECIINCKIDKTLIAQVKKALIRNKLRNVLTILTRKQEVVKTCIAIVLTEILSKLNDGKSLHSYST